MMKGEIKNFGSRELLRLKRFRNYIEYYNKLILNEINIISKF